MQNEIIKYLKQYLPIPEDLEKIILENSIFRKIKKGTILLKESEVSNECYFILKGCMKRYYMVDGDEKITGFFTEGQVVIPASYTDRLPSKYYLSCLENTFASFGNPETENDLYKRYPQLESITRVLGEKLMVSMSNEFDDWVSLNPEDRYLQLIKKRPELIQRVPQYQLANYLGIKPQSLSRIRKRLAKNDSKMFI
ncbi:MAG: Crp/Fnr family transcriptional regulator [Cyclobacteriaceae bacterium]